LITWEEHLQGSVIKSLDPFIPSLATERATSASSHSYYIYILYACVASHALKKREDAAEGVQRRW